MGFPNTPQTVTTQRPAVAYPGQKSDSGYSDSRSVIAQVPIAWGQGVCKGTNTASPDRTLGGILPTSGADVTSGFLGIAQQIAQRMPVPGSAFQYAAGDSMIVVTQGRIWVQVDATAGASLVDEGPVYMVNSGAQAGNFRGDTGAGGTAATLVPRATCRTGGLAGQVAEVSVNLP